MRYLSSVIAVILATTTTTTTAFSATSKTKVPSWKMLKSILSPTITKTKPNTYTYSETQNNPSILLNNNNQYVFYRDTNAQCPYAQRVHLALELKQLDYTTVLQTPRNNKEDKHGGPLLGLPDGTLIYDSIQALEEIQKISSDVSPNLFPRVSGSVDGVRANINRRSYIFPRNTIFLEGVVPSLFKNNAENDDGTVEMVAKSNHDVTCEEIDEMLEEYPDGPFLCGEPISACDISWMPFVERYVSQLPLLYPEVKPRSDFEEIKVWLDAMERLNPCYSCVVRGDAMTYGMQLVNALKKKQKEGVLKMDESTISIMEKSVSTTEDPIGIKRKRRGIVYNPSNVWSTYAQNKDYLANTPHEECASCLVKLRHDLFDQITDQWCKEEGRDKEDMDMALRQVINCILTDFTSSEDEFCFVDGALSKLSGDARDVASMVNECISVPRDMGAIPASVLRKLVLDAPKPRIL
mmetsp:Transcript_18971/g.28293  ORF Transcript_18971/g.28293 Transcript_18971/m.28293 type:complete len:465 (-) Transcript_18971:188-1582(-)